MVSVSNHRRLEFESGDNLKMDRHQSAVSLFKISAEPLATIALLFTWIAALWSVVALKHVPVEHALTVVEGSGSVEATIDSKAAGNPQHSPFTLDSTIAKFRCPWVSAHPELV